MKSLLIKYKNVILTIIALVLTMAILCLLLYRPFLSIISDPQGFRSNIESYGILGYGIMVGIIIIQMILAFLPGEPVEFAAGFCFGAFGGTIVCLFANLIGATLIFILMRYLSKNLIYRFFDEQQVESLEFLKKEEKLEIILFIVFFIPGTPKDLLAYFAPLTPIPLWRFVVLTTIARIPSIVSSTIAGSAVLSSEYSLVILIYAITGLLAIGGIVLYNHYIARHKTTI